MTNDLSGGIVALDLTDRFSRAAHGQFYALCVPDFKTLLGLAPDATLEDFPERKDPGIKTSLRLTSGAAAYIVKTGNVTESDTTAPNTSIMMSYEFTPTNLAVQIKDVLINGHRLKITQQSLQDVAGATQNIIDHIQNGSPICHDSLSALSAQAKKDHTQKPSAYARLMATLRDYVPNFLTRTQ